MENFKDEIEGTEEAYKTYNYIKNRIKNFRIFRKMQQKFIEHTEEYEYYVLGKWD